MVLPFGENSFAKKMAPSTSANVTTAPLPPPAAKNAPPPLQRHRKRVQVTIANPNKGDNFKRSKTATTESSSAAIILDDLIKDNFRDEDITN